MGFLRPATLLEMYRVSVRSIIEYAFGYWGWFIKKKSLKDLETFQIKCLKRIFRAKEPHIALLIEGGLERFVTRRSQQGYGLFKRLIDSPCFFAKSMMRIVDPEPSAWSEIVREESGYLVRLWEKPEHWKPSLWERERSWREKELLNP
jgi:hypothetical protein